MEVGSGNEAVTTDTSITPVTNDHGDIEFLVAEGRDITERKKRERELKCQNERFEQFASVLSHDLRNPLGVAEGCLELLQEEGNEDRFEKIRNAHDRIERIIEDVLTLARQGKAISEANTRYFPVDQRQASVLPRSSHRMMPDSATDLPTSGLTRSVSPLEC